MFKRENILTPPPDLLTLPRQQKRKAILEWNQRPQPETHLSSANICSAIGASGLRARSRHLVDSFYQAKK